METKKIINIGLIILIILIIGAGVKFVFFYGRSGGNSGNCQPISIKKMYLDSLRQDSIRQDSIRMIHTYDHGLNVSSDCEDALMKLHDSLVILKYELDICRGVKTLKPVFKQLSNGGPKKELKQNKIVVTNNQPNIDLVDQNSFKPNSESNDYKSELDGGQYVGLKDGDFYVTISSDNFIQYVFKKRLYDKAGGNKTPELNSKGSGQKFELVGDEYVYTDKAAVANPATVSATYIWTIYIGEKEGYSAFLPHEVIKPEIKQARGSLAGSISPDDVIKIGQYVPEVKKGRIKPNKVEKAGTDKLNYEGWHFCNSVLYKKVN